MAPFPWYIAQMCRKRYQPPVPLQQLAILVTEKMEPGHCRAQEKKFIHQRWKRDKWLEAKEKLTKCEKGKESSCGCQQGEVSLQVSHDAHLRCRLCDLGPD